MRPLAALGTVACLALLCAAIVASGRYAGTSTDEGGGEIAVETIDPDMLPPEPAEAPDGPVTVGATQERVLEPSELGGRLVAPQKAPQADPEPKPPVHRIPPRHPLSRLGQAKEPPVDDKADWDGTSLFRPVATAAGTFEAMGYTVSLVGTEVIGPNETCSYRGSDWPCGVRARTEFRQLLRGRAVVCAIPEGEDAKAVAANCRIGTQNLGSWLVENGWARAAANGPYVEAGKKAEEASKGIFGPPPR